MRLICGLVRLDDAPADSAILDAMVSALTSPGMNPGISRRIDRVAALAVLDFADPAPPGLPVGPDGTWLAGDPRLDRPRDLADALGLPATTDPMGLLFAAHERWGKDLPDKVDGDFAVAFWNSEQRRLTCSRDIMGVRPLCYRHEPGRWFAFASLPRGLHAAGLAPPELDYVTLGRQLARSSVRTTATGVKGVRWVAAGASLTVTPDGLKSHQAWRPSTSMVGTWRGSADDAAAQLRTLVEDAVACRLPPAGPVAAHLSGGLDSSAVAVIAARRLRAEGRRLHAFSQLAEPVPGLVACDEREYVNAVLAQEPDIVWQPAYLPPLDAPGIEDDDLLPPGALLVPDDAMCAAAAAAGATLLLSGAGGDEIATYNAAGIYAALFRMGQWTTLCRELPLRARGDGRSTLRAALALVIAPHLPSWFLALAQRLRRQPQASDRSANGLDFVRQAFAREVLSGLPPTPSLRNRPRDRIWMLTESYLVARAETWAILGARHGVAFSFPLEDRRIVDFILKLPLERFLDKGFSRQPFRNAMAGVLPDSIRWRKTKFSPYPDAPLKLAAAKPALLIQIESLRSDNAVTARFDLDAIASAIRAVPEGAEIERIAETYNAAAPGSPQLQRGMMALRALGLARRIARLA